MFSLKGKVAIVTGGAGHLGMAISEGLAEFGANLVVASTSFKKCDELSLRLSQEYGIKARGIEFDIRSFESITSCLEEVYAEMGSIDILVNNAAFGKPNMSIETLSEKDWLEGIDGTLNGVFRCTRSIIPYMQKKKYGVIINISSMYAMVSPDDRIYGNSGYKSPPDYGAGKAAIIQFTRHAACHLAKDGIRVNAISPGPFPNISVQQNKSFIKRLEKKVPLGRIGNPNEIKGAVVFLASAASSYVTGQNIIVDGGWTTW